MKADVQVRIPQVMNLMDTYIRNMNKYWSKMIREAETENNDDLRLQVLADTFHMVRTAAVLVHPIARSGTEMIREYLNVGEELWSWDRIFDPIYFLHGQRRNKLKIP